LRETAETNTAATGTGAGLRARPALKNRVFPKTPDRPGPHLRKNHGVFLDAQVFQTLTLTEKPRGFPGRSGLSDPHVIERKACFPVNVLVAGGIPEGLHLQKLFFAQRY
jgi:hypothetical protein